MDPVTAGIGLVSALAPALGALIGNLFGAGDRAKAEQMLDQALQQYAGLSLPDLKDLPPSELAKLAPDNSLKDAQYGALDKLQQMEAGGGFTLEDRAALNKVQNRVGSDFSGQVAALRENMAARGTGGSGAEVALAQGSQQAAANRMNEAGTQTAAQAQRRYYDSILERGGYAGKVREQEYGERANAAQANDQVAWWNRVKLPEKRHEAQMDLADTRAGALTRMARHYGDRAGAAAQTGYGVGQGVSEAGNAALAYRYRKPKRWDEDDEPAGTW